MSGLSVEDPIGLVEALTSQYVIPGDTIYLLDGIYTGNFTCSLNGTAENPITIRPYPGSRAIIDGKLTIEGSYTNWVEIENTLIGTYPRATDVPGSDPPIVAGGITILGDHIKMINCIIYDLVNVAIGWWEAANGGELYGCFTFNNGWIGPDRGHGHGIYTQNLGESDIKTVKHCVLGTNFAGSLLSLSTNLACYGLAGHQKNFRFTECAMIDGNQLVGGNGVENVVMDKCHIHEDRLTIGYEDVDNVDMTITDCIIRGEFCPFYMPTFTMSGCRIYSSHEKYVVYGLEPAGGVVAYNLSGNAYHYDGEAATPFYGTGVAKYDFAGWQAQYNTDADSTYTTDPPDTNAVFVYANEYLDAGSKRMGFVVIWNWEGLDSVDVDMTALGLNVGTTYKLRSALDYFGDVSEFVEDGDPVAVDMRAVSHTLSVPSGYAETIIEQTFPAFGVFLVERTI